MSVVGIATFVARTNSTFCLPTLPQWRNYSTQLSRAYWQHISCRRWKLHFITCTICWYTHAMQSRTLRSKRNISVNCFNCMLFERFFFFFFFLEEERYRVVMSVYVMEVKGDWRVLWDIKSGIGNWFRIGVYRRANICKRKKRPFSVCIYFLSLCMIAFYFSIKIGL